MCNFQWIKMHGETITFVIEFCPVLKYSDITWLNVDKIHHIKFRKILLIASVEETCLRKLLPPYFGCCLHRTVTNILTKKIHKHRTVTNILTKKIHKYLRYINTLCSYRMQLKKLCFSATGCAWSPCLTNDASCRLHRVSAPAAQFRLRVLAE